MKTEAEIRMKGIQARFNAPGPVAAERLLAAVSRGKFDYTQWRKVNLPKTSVDEIAKAASKRAEDVNRHPQPHG